MKKPPPICHDPDDGWPELRAMVAEVLQRRARTGGQAGLAALRELKTVLSS
jgi:hypothetical protein